MYSHVIKDKINLKKEEPDTEGLVSVCKGSGHRPVAQRLLSMVRWPWMQSLLLLEETRPERSKERRTERRRDEEGKAVRMRGRRGCKGRRKVA